MASRHQVSFLALFGAALLLSVTACNRLLDPAQTPANDQNSPTVLLKAGDRYFAMSCVQSLGASNLSEISRCQADPSAITVSQKSQGRGVARWGGNVYPFYWILENFNPREFCSYLFGNPFDCYAYFGIRQVYQPICPLNVLYNWNYQSTGYENCGGYWNPNPPYGGGGSSCSALKSEILSTLAGLNTCTQSSDCEAYDSQTQNCPNWVGINFNSNPGVLSEVRAWASQYRQQGCLPYNNLDCATNVRAFSCVSGQCQ